MASSPHHCCSRINLESASPSASVTGSSLTDATDQEQTIFSGYALELPASAPGASLLNKEARNGKTRKGGAGHNQKERSQTGPDSFGRNNISTVFSVNNSYSATL